MHNRTDLHNTLDTFVHSRYVRLYDEVGRITYTHLVPVVYSSLSCCYYRINMLNHRQHKMRMGDEQGAACHLSMLCGQDAYVTWSRPPKPHRCRWTLSSRTSSVRGASLNRHRPELESDQSSPPTNPAHLKNALRMCPIIFTALSARSSVDALPVFRRVTRSRQYPLRYR